MRRLLLVGVLLCLAPSGYTAECGAQTMHTLSRFLRGGVKADDAPRLIQALDFVWRWPVEDTAKFEDLVALLSNRSVNPVEGEANPLHLIRALSGWTNDPNKALLYLTALDFFRTTPSQLGAPLKLGLDRAYPTAGSTSNMRRVAGATTRFSTSVAEAWEVAAMHLIVSRPGQFHTLGAFGQPSTPLVVSHSDVESFGRKIVDVEADVWVTGAERALFDMKHTLGQDEIETISESLMLRWQNRLKTDVDRVFIPVNQPPSDLLKAKFRRTVTDAEALSRTVIVVMPGYL